ncbi:MAG: carboxylating nicotinate-nucleotide diphosphorylase, partial [Terriglobia bacterium]
VFSGERVALNFMQRMSGIASLTAKFVAKVRGYPARIYDTRKTGPGLRAFDKYAVSAGGGANHRLGLYDAVLIKDNHVRLSGSIEAAVTNVRNSLGAETEIEVEVETLAEVLDAIRLGADVILLDNMSLSMVENAVDAIGDKAVVEVSGGVTLENVEAIAQTGVARISVGRITQGAEPLDMALEIKT